VCGNRLLRKLIGPNGEEGAGYWRRLHSGELHNLCAPQNIVRVMKSRKMRLTGHVARMGDEKCVEDFGRET